MPIPSQEFRKLDLRFCKWPHSGPLSRGGTVKIVRFFTKFEPPHCPDHITSGDLRLIPRSIASKHKHTLSKKALPSYFERIFFQSFITLPADAYLQFQCGLEHVLDLNRRCFCRFQNIILQSKAIYPACSFHVHYVRVTTCYLLLLTRVKLV